MEGLYPNTNIYPSSSYMMQHSDQPSYYSPPSTLPYRSTALATTNHSAFSDVKPYNGCVPSSSPSSPSSSPHSDSLSLISSSQPHRNNSISSLPTTNTSSSMVNWSSPAPGFAWPNPYPPSNHYSAVRPNPSYSSSTSCYSLSPHTPIQRPKLTTTVWEDEGTVCYQVDAKSVCVARRQDNDMINGTKLLNVVGMSRGKRDGILKNEKGRVVVKVGAMHLKGVWITFERAKDLAAKFKITDILYPLFTDDPSVFLCPSTIPGSTAAVLPCQSNGMIPRSIAPPSYSYKQEQSSFGFSMPTWGRSCPPNSNNDTIDHPESFTNILRSNDPTDLPSGSCSPVPGTIAPITTDDIYLMNNPYDYPLTSRSTSSVHHSAPSSHYLYSSPQQPPRLASITTSDYDTFSRKPMMKPPTNPSYPHSPPHEEMKPSHHSSSALLAHSSGWSPSLDCAKTAVPPPIKEASHSRKRSAQSDSPSSPKRAVKRVRALNH